MVKNIKKLTILMIAVVAIGTFALPTVLTASQGQHTFIAGSNVKCEKCHTISSGSSGVAGEIEASNNTDYGSVDNTNAGGVGTLTVGELNMLTGYGTGYAAGEKIHADVGCKGCHTVVNKVSDDTRSIMTSTHAGVTRQVVCDSCHVHVTAAGIELRGADEVHNNDAGGLATVGNTACIGCHTEVKVTGSVSYGFTFAAQDIGTTGLHISAQ